MEWYHYWLIIFAVVLVFNAMIAIRNASPGLATLIAIMDIVTIYAITQVLPA